jgi:hypothetical protein
MPDSALVSPFYGEGAYPLFVLDAAGRARRHAPFQNEPSQPQGERGEPRVPVDGVGKERNAVVSAAMFD